MPSGDVVLCASAKRDAIGTFTCMNNLERIKQGGDNRIVDILLKQCWICLNIFCDIIATEMLFVA